MKCYLIILLLGVLPLTLAAAPGQNAYLDAAEKFYIEWDYSDTNITILCRVKTTGWFGIGFSPNGGMAGADIITAGVRDGKPYLQDRHSERNGYPSVDKSQDVHLISGSESDGVTTIKFTRKHNTCDDEDMVIGTDTLRVIHAISPDGSDDLKYHTATNRGTKSLYLRQKVGTENKIPDNALVMDITVQNIDIPAFHTRYYCELKRVPEFDVKHHLIKVEPLIQEENLGIVHHIIIYGCFDGKDRDHYFKKQQTGYDCYEGNMPDDLEKCRSPVVTWAIGGGEMNYPPEAGYPFGESASPDYFMMEVHYDNPQLLTGRKDNSGIRMTFTPTLRPYDAAIVAVGGIHGITVPPGVEDFQYHGICTGECSGKLMKEPTKIVGSYLHAHLAARGITARQFRNGQEVQVIDEDRHYDFNYQQYKEFSTPIEFLPGDSMQITCHYDTRGRTNMTFGGLPSDNEMCIAFLTVYPAPELNECYSAPGWAGDWNVAKNFFNKALGYNNIPKPEWFMQSMNRLTGENGWTDARIKALEEAQLNQRQYDLCTDKKRNFVWGWGQKTFDPAPAMRTPLPDRDYNGQCKKDAVIGK